MSDIRYVIKCFDSTGDCALSLVVDRADLFDVIEHYKTQYKVKAFVLNNDEKEF